MQLRDGFPRSDREERRAAGTEPDAHAPKRLRADIENDMRRAGLEQLQAVIEDVRMGEYVIVHVGFAISRVDEAEAIRTMELINEMQGGMDELRAGDAIS